MRRPRFVVFVVLVVFVALAACAAPGHGGRDRQPILAFAGTVTWEGHFRRPHEVRSIDAGLVLVHEGERTRIEFVESWNRDRAPVRTVLVRTAAGCCLREPGAAGFRRDDGSGDRLVSLLLAAAEPGHRPCAIAWQHARLGDLEDRASWEDTTAGPVLRVVWHRAHDAAEFALHEVPAPIVDRSTAFEVGEPAATGARPTAVRFTTLAPGVHEIVLPDADTRSLAVEFADHVVLCEASVDNRAGERLLAALDEHLPGKPVRYVLFGHYHPHYTGGLRPLLARGAVVVAPPLGAAFAREIAGRSFRSPPDALALSGRAPVVEQFTGERAFRDATNELVAIDIGADSQHTDEYVVFHLPRQRILFQGDLGWFMSGDGLRAGGDRARGLLHAIDDRHLDVGTLVQGWPTVGRATITLDELRELTAR